MELDDRVWEKVFKKLSVSPEDILRKINKHLSQRKAMYATLGRCAGTDLQGKTIVEVGAGTAIECLLFSLRGARCYAIDFELEAMQYARAVSSFFAFKPMLNVGNGLLLPVKNNRADLVFSQGFFEHFDPDDMKTLLLEQQRILKPNGFLLIDVPNFYSPYEVYKQVMGLFGSWMYGKEVGIKKRMLLSMAGECGLELVEWYGWSFKGYPYKSVLDFIYMVPLLLIRNVLIMTGYGHDSIGLLFKKKIQQ